MRLENKGLVIFLITLMSLSCTQASDSDKNSKTDKMQEQSVPAEFLDSATLGAGCFWCVEAVFQDIKGVVHVESGYSGGHVENPSYSAVCNGNTGHIEVARIVFDTRVVSYETLLNVFWHIHDPTTKDRQGADRGEQYRSVIFYHSEEQREIAERSKKAIEESGLWENPIVTVIEPLKNYYKAENYHQDYYNNNKSQGYCSAVIGPKIAKFRKQFPELLKSTATSEH